MPSKKRRNSNQLSKPGTPRASLLQPSIPIPTTTEAAPSCPLDRSTPQHHGHPYDRALSPLTVWTRTCRSMILESMALGQERRTGGMAIILLLLLVEVMRFPVSTERSCRLFGSIRGLGMGV